MCSHFGSTVHSDAHTAAAAGATATVVIDGNLLDATSPRNRPTDLPEDMVAFRVVTLDEILANKQTRLGGLLTVREDETVYHAIGVMEKAGVGAVLVKNADGQFTGIFTERDYMRKIALQGKSSRTTKIRDVMTSPPTIVPSSATAIQIMKLMTARRFRHAPVRHDATGEVVGIVSIGDIMATVLREYKDSVSFFRDMIAGKYSQ